MPKAKTNPRRVPVAPAERERIRRKALKDCWAILFTVLADKEAYGVKKLRSLWEQVNDTSCDVISGKKNFDTLVNDLNKQYGIEVRRVLHGAENNADSVRKIFEAKAWAIMLTALITLDALSEADLKRIWAEILDAEDSRKRGYFKTSDLINTLYDEQKVRLI